jgi:hypothetical protein
MAHRTALITAGSIAVVVFAAAVAIGANLGILDVADSRPVGKLSASAAAQPAGAQVVEVRAPARSAKTVSQKYIIKKAGMVEVAVTKAGVRLVDVTVKRHWTWTLAQSANKRLRVTFRSGSHTYKFLAVLGRHRTIVARVDEPVTKVVPSGSGATVVAWSPTPTTVSANAAPTHGGESDGGGDGGASADD